MNQSALEDFGGSKEIDQDCHGLLEFTVLSQLREYFPKNQQSMTTTVTVIQLGNVCR